MPVFDAAAILIMCLKLVNLKDKSCTHKQSEVKTKDI
jgi:hypothetical protein